MLSSCYLKRGSYTHANDSTITQGLSRAPDSPTQSKKADTVRPPDTVKNTTTTEADQ